MEGTIAEIRMFAGNFPPQTWAFCNGQILSIAANTALFALVGTFYGGNGTTTFALPDFRGRSPFGTGTGPGLPTIVQAEMAGTETSTLLLNNLPLHNHTISGAAAMIQGAKAERVGSSASPVSNYPSIINGQSAYSATSDGNMAPMRSNVVVGAAGSSAPFAKRPPYLGINFIICLQGIFPSRN